MKRHFICWLIICAATVLRAADDVTWNSLGSNENNSMPIGNGDICVNAWTEQGGDIVLLLAKSDAWSENGQLLKLGRVRVHLTPNPFATDNSFSQTLKLSTGEIQFKAGHSVAHLWVDADNPVVHLELQAEHPIQLQATSEVWRSAAYHLNQKAVQEAGIFEWGSKPDGLTFDPDVIFPSEGNKVAWCHFNTRSLFPLVFQRENLDSLLPRYPDPLLNRCFGVVMKGPHLVAKNNLTLNSTGAFKSLRLDLYALTQQVKSPAAWQAALNDKVKLLDKQNLSVARRAHQKWWGRFWNRSWIVVSGAPDAAKVSQGYAIQRYMDACAGRGAQPIKFNGSLFTVGHDLPEGVHSSAKNHNPDFRAWGDSYWNQNNRFIYWPLIASGDDDLLAPWFQMYVRALPLVKDRARTYFHHGGAAFIETIDFWGLPNVNDFGWSNPGPELQSPWIRNHIQGGLDVIAQMLDYYDSTQNATFARSSLLPMADAVLTYYDQHWKTNVDGKLFMAPAQSIETYQTATNPTPDIAGLMSIVPRLLSLPATLVTPGETNSWARLLQKVPPLPMGTTAGGKLPPRAQGDPDGTPTILPAQAYGKTRNSENPELYTVFPYRLYGVGKPDLKLARDTYRARLFPYDYCWGQDGVESALLGLTAEAEKAVVREFTKYVEQQFRWFWAKNSDWIPDMDNGGAGMMTLQLMLMQCDGKRIQLLPAWPKAWTADFKLYAPYQTTVEGHVEEGKVTKLKVTPANRTSDVVMVAPSLR